MANVSSVYELVSVNFNPDNRNAKIEFKYTTEYRTIERYVTRNYQKYPIYSNLKFRSKDIVRNIKLTNSELEKLESNADPLIKHFSYDIVSKLNDKELTPSWYRIDLLEKEYKQNINEINENNENFKMEKQNEIIKKEKTVFKIDTDIWHDEKKLTELKRKEDRISKKLNKIVQKNVSVILSILTLGIYSYYISEKRKNKFNNKLETVRLQVETYEMSISEFNKKKTDCLSDIEDIKKAIEEKEKEKEALLLKEKTNFNLKCADVKPLNIRYRDDDNSFVPLKNLSGFEKEKIIGCYVIHNREKTEKYYVGQSKDVIKRLNNHFKGTVPKNPIFSEDYYLSSYENKEDLFEFKIIRCETKDELDSTEKHLIEEYDAFNSGYNSTKGNS